MNMRRRICVSLGLGATLAPAFFSSIARASEAWRPDRPVHFVVPYAPGGASDTFARLLSEPVTRSLGQMLLVENKAGAGGIIAADHVAKAAPDGYTLLMAVPSTQLINPYLYKNLPYDPNAFTVIGPLYNVPNLLVVHPSVPAHSISELIALAKQQPGKLNFSSSGPGSSSHLSGEMFNLMADVRMIHVPYRGSGPAMIDLVAGRVQLTIDNNISALLPYIRSGALRPLGISSLTSNPLLPEVPTIASSLPGYESGAITYVLAPQNTPRSVVDTIATAFRDALAEPEIQRRILELGYEILTDTPAQLNARILREQAKWKNVIEKAHITL